MIKMKCIDVFVGTPWSVFGAICKYIYHYDYKYWYIAKLAVLCRECVHVLFITETCKFRRVSLKCF